MLDELQVEREQEEHAQIAREDRGHGQVGPGEVPVPEDGERDEGVRRPLLVRDEHREQDERRDQRWKGPGI